MENFDTEPNYEEALQDLEKRGQEALNADQKVEIALEAADVRLKAGWSKDVIIADLEDWREVAFNENREDLDKLLRDKIVEIDSA